MTSFACPNICLKEKKLYTIYFVHNFVVIMEGVLHMVLEQVQPFEIGPPHLPLW